MTTPLLQCQNAIRSDLGLEFTSQQACLMISFIVSSSPLLGGSFLLVMEKDCCPWIKSWAWKTKGWLRTARLFSLHTTSSFAVLADSRKNSERGQILKGLQGKEHHAVLRNWLERLLQLKAVLITVVRRIEWESLKQGNVPDIAGVIGFESETWLAM